MKVFCAFSLLIMSVIIVALGYGKIDSMMTISYLKDDLHSEQKNRIQMEWILSSLLERKPKTEVLSILNAEAKSRANEQEVLIKDESSIVWFDQLQFHFDSDLLVFVGNGKN